MRRYGQIVLQAEQHDIPPNQYSCVWTYVSVSAGACVGMCVGEVEVNSDVI